MTWQPELTFAPTPETHRRPTQAGRILAHLQAGRSLTPLDALRLFGCFRLGARVHELKAEGWNITSELIDAGDGKRVAQYRMEVAQ